MVTEEQLMMVYQLGYTHGKEFAIARRKFMDDLIEKDNKQLYPSRHNGKSTLSYEKFKNSLGGDNT